MNPHTWFLARLDLHRAGLRDSATERLFSAHQKSCPSCARALAQYATPDEESIASPHLPPIVLGAWLRAQRDLRGLERRLAREHLERCPSCREELRLLGYEARLSPDPALEAPAHDVVLWSPAAGTAARGAGPGITPAAPMRKSPPRPRGRARGPGRSTPG